MKHPSVVILFLIIATIFPSFAQESSVAGSDLQNYLQATDKKQETILQNSQVILQKISGIEKQLAPVGAAASAPLAADLEERLRVLESKLNAVNSESTAPAAAEAAAPDEALQGHLNVVWITIAAALVFFMQAGFCLLELGLTRAKNAINICMKNFLDFSAGALCFLFLGFALMFGDSLSGWVGLGPFWISDKPGDDAFWAFWLFQTVFAGTAATIISGAMAERTKFVGYLIFTIVMTGLIYPIAGHWAWGSFGGGFGYGGGQGWLEKLGYVDFAGSSVVHGIGGAAALAGVLILGPRIGRFREDGSSNLIAGHNLPLAALGTFILWFGWYGFNAGSTLVGDFSIGRIAANTTLAPAAGAMAAMVAIWITQGRPDLGITLNGALGGLVGITANCHAVSPASAVMIGLVAGVLATLASLLLERLHIDDAVGAVPVHLVCGWWGVLAVALFDEAGFSPQALGVQALGVASITGFAFVMSLIAFKLVDVVVGLRASPEEQDLGLDFTEHSGTAYADFVTSEHEIPGFSSTK